ncbi:MAG: insulinase family protein [Bdellovibrio sp. CG10_big_fil_rev_8_21_14_0_10_47_8]|nr:MAG: insulinase family protein [Bdellovibrio sp. CG10_big_fil_rev_8_21_14_0_10_47_8]
MVKKYQLKNGMKVLLQESHKSPVVSVQVWVRTGSADEAKGEEGISHFIEHLVFKGTRKFKVGEIASVIEGSGGELNAYTSFDQTVFYVTISKNFLETGLQALAEMMGFPLFDPVEIDNEREVVVEEIKRGQDSLGSRASHLLFSTVYKKHPYGIPVIGYEKNVRKWKAKKIVDYYHSRYSPQNMFLVISGDIDSQSIKPSVEKHFGEFKPYKIKKVRRKKEPAQKTNRIQVEKSEFEQCVSYLAWRSPDISHVDVPALDVLAVVLGQGDSSKLVHKMRIEEPLVNSVGASAFSSQDPGFFAVSMSYNKENLAEASNKMTDVLMDVFRGDVQESEVRKAIVNLESENDYAMETVDGLSRKTGDAEFLFEDPKYNEKYIQQIKKVTAQDVHRVAKKYLKTTGITITSITNDNPKAVKKIWTEWAKNFQRRAKATKALPLSKKKLITAKRQSGGAKKSENTTQVIELKNGVRLLARPCHDTQVLSVKIAALGGGRAESSDRSGMTELLSRVWTGGTKNRTEQEIYAQIDSIAAGIQPSAGRNSMGMGLDALALFEKEAQELFFDVLLEPVFSEEVVDRERKIQLENLRTRNDNPAQIAIRQLMKNLFSQHPYGRDLMGDEKTLANIHSTDISRFWNDLMVRKNMTVMLSGNVDLDSWVEQFEKRLIVRPVGQKFSQQFPVHFPQKKSVHYTMVKKEQSHLVVAYPGLRITDKDRFTLQIIQSILAGQGGRLFIELRDKNSLAYSVSPLRMEGIEAGYFGAYIGCSPEKVGKAFEMMNQEFQKLCEKKVDVNELTRAQRYLVGRHDIDLQRVSSIAASILYDDIYGIPFDESFHLDKKYFAVTPEDVQRVAQNIFNAVPVISLAGPTNPLSGTETKV